MFFRQEKLGRGEKETALQGRVLVADGGMSQRPWEEGRISAFAKGSEMGR